MVDTPTKTDTMDNVSFLDALDAEIECRGAVNLFEEPTNEAKLNAFGLHHHTVLKVDTTLTRETRNRKPSVRMAEYKSNGDKQIGISGLRLGVVCQEVDSNHFLWCNEDTSFMFSQNPDQSDTDEATYSEIQFICDSIMPMSC